MRFSVDGWDPAYGTSLELEEFLGESTARVDVDVELPAGRWRAIDPVPAGPCPRRCCSSTGCAASRPGSGSREARATAGNEASAALCASYAAGVVCCCARQAHLVLVETRRGLFTVAPQAGDIMTWAGAYTACHTTPNAARPLSVTLSQALQRRLGDVEVQDCGRGPGGHGRARRARGRRPAGDRRAAARAAAPAPRARLHQVAPHHLSAAGAERARGRAVARPAHPGVPDRHELGPAHLVPAPARNGRRAVGGHRAHRVLRRPARCAR